ncbi:MAG: OadG family protein [Clostridia bacterium]|nr:OadG family protein [Clostridia bacterium]
MIPAIANAAVNNGFVVAMGIGTVFVGLICIILLIKLMSMVTALFTANAPAQAAPAAPAAPAAAPTAPAASTAIENRAEIVAAVCAAAAEEMGTDISALRVVSFKKIS